MNSRKTLKYYTIIALLGSIYLIIQIFHRGYYRVIQPEHFLIAHAHLEVFSIIVAFTIALQCFVSYPFTKSDKKFFIGIIFILIGLADLMHVLTFTMHLGLTGTKACYYWLIARLTGAGGLILYLLDIYLKKNTSLVFGSIYGLTVLIAVMLWGNYLPPELLNIFGDFNNLRIWTTLFICLLNIIALIILAYQRRMAKTDPPLNLTYALILLILCKIFFITSQDIYDLNNLLSHVFKFLGYTLILECVLIKSLREPFQKIENSLQHSNTIFEFAPVGISIIRKLDSTFVKANQSLCNYLGLPEGKIIGKTPLEVGFSTADWPKIVDFANNSSCTETPLINLEIPIKKEGNQISIAAISAQNIELDQEKCILMSITDITELKKLNMEMTRLDRLNLVGQMAAGIAHEIRNPMTTVKGYLQLMSEKPQNLEQKSTIRFMIEELDRANAIIKEYLTLAKASETSYQSQCLNDVLQNLYPLIEADAFTQNKQIRFYPGRIPCIEINPQEITQLVLNLCRNGLEAMAEGGCLTVQTYQKDAHNVVLSIKDEGHGIPADLLEKLGTPFFTTKENGTGLGLAICYKIAQSHGAKIDVNSDCNGTEFIISFPLALE